MKRIFVVLLVAGLLLSGCNRAASTTNLSPIDQAQTAGAGTALPTDLSGTAVPDTDTSSLPETLPVSEKGYELYSWQSNSSWYFTLITGTNATKDFNDIVTAGNTLSDDGFVKITVRGVDAIKDVLKRVPADSRIIWGGMVLPKNETTGSIYLSYPPDLIVQDIETTCSDLGLNLTTIQAQ
jgi:uncharacterized protein YceK